MPLRPVCGKLQMPVTSAEDVRRIFAFGRGLRRKGPLDSEWDDYRRDLDDYFYYIGAVHPQFAQPLQRDFATLPDDELDNFFFSLHTWLYIMSDAPDSCINILMQRLQEHPHHFVLEHMLLSIGTPAALAAVADYARAFGRVDEFAQFGIWVPSAGPAEERFARQRWAARAEPFAGSDADFLRLVQPVGLPIAAVMDDPAQALLTWHYATVDLTDLPGLASLGMPRLHLISPPLHAGWTVFCDLTADDCYAHPRLSDNARWDDEEVENMRTQAEEYAHSGRARLVLLPYDDELVYCNGHTQMTPGVEGDIGGPPIGLDGVPNCPACGKLMFHIGTLTVNIREYGEGFRSLFACETCRVVANMGTTYN